MRPETKERADTIIGPVLRGSFTFYQATAGDMGGSGWRREMETESNGKRVRERREREARRQQERKKKVGLQRSFRGRNDLTG